MNRLKIFTFFENALSFLLIFCLTGMIIVVSMQIMARFFLPVTPPWTEELARMFFIYLVSLGAGLAIKEKAYVNVDTLVNLFPVRLKWWNEFINLVAIAFLMVLMLIYALEFVRLGALQRSPSLEIRMFWIYISMFVLPLFTLFYVLAQIGELMASLRKKKL